MSSAFKSAFLCAVIACLPYTSYAAEITLKFAHNFPPNSPAAFGASRLSQLVQKELPDKLEIQVFPAGQLVSGNAVVPALSSGSIDIAVISTPAATQLFPPMSVFELPFIFEDLGAAARFEQTSTGKKLLDDFGNKVNVSGLDYWHSTMLVAAGKLPWTSPAVIKGMKVASPFTGQIAPSILKLGAIALTIPASDVPSALQMGSVDAIQASPTFLATFLVATKAYHAVDYLTETRHAYIGYLVLANKSVLPKLSTDVRSKFLKLLEATKFETNNYAVDENSKAYEEAKSRGVKIVSLLGSQREAWKKASQVIWTDYEKIVGKEIIQAAAGTAGGGDPCSENQCRCRNRTCSKDCCIK